MSNYSPLQHLASAIWLNDDVRKRYFAVMNAYTAYFDASGSPDQGSFIVVAGYVATVDEWRTFDSEWKDILASFKIKQLHMKNFIHRTGEFTNKKWEREEYRTEFVVKLVKTIKNHVDHSITVVLPLDLWADVNKDYRLREAKLTPYALSGVSAIGFINRWATGHVINPKHIRFVFEDGDKDKGHLITTVETYYKFTPIFEKKADVISFQPCDLLAWEAHCASKSVKEKGDSYQMRKSLDALLDAHYDDGEYTDRELRKVCSDLGISKRD